MLRASMTAVSNPILLVEVLSESSYVQLGDVVSILEEGELRLEEIYRPKHERIRTRSFPGVDLVPGSPRGIPPLQSNIF